MTNSPTTLTAPYEEVDNISRQVLEAIEDENVGVAVLGVALTLGRLLAVSDLAKFNEQEFVSAVLDFAGAYVASVEGNVH